MDAIEALRIANDELMIRLRLVTDEHLDLPTPCTEWNVRQLINHLLLGGRMSVQVLDGMERDEIIAQLDDDMYSAADDPVAAVQDWNQQVLDRFAAPGGLDGMVAHPGGDFPRTVFIGFRSGDATVHAWDIARAIGSDETLHAGLVQYEYDTTAPMADMLVGSGLFGDGPSGAADDRSVQDRYLDLTGRRP